MGKTRWCICESDKSSSSFLPFNSLTSKKAASPSFVQLLLVMNSLLHGISWFKRSMWKSHVWVAKRVRPETRQSSASMPCPEHADAEDSLIAEAEALGYICCSILALIQSSQWYLPGLPSIVAWLRVQHLIQINWCPKKADDTPILVDDPPSLRTQWLISAEVLNIKNHMQQPPNR